MKSNALMAPDELLDEVKSLKNIPSDFKLADFLEVKNQTLYGYRSGKSLPDDEVCFRIAGATGRAPEYVIACIHAARAKTPHARTAWAHIAARFGTAACLVALVGILAQVPH